ncbi:MAG TPA: S8 family serine peptidase [Myxococcota bacterium]|nr:S8 family serine peptidase [Myxococcota bacterium]HRY91849.1 S8 family serine peptidase [Myxococcota bacterium]HSA20564.1 S8 family serine peptidase [Myxococcota bacterium]
MRRARLLACLGTGLLLAGAARAGPVLGPRLALELRAAGDRPGLREADPGQLVTTWDAPGQAPAGAVCVGRACALVWPRAALPALLARPGLRRVDRPGRFRPRLEQAGASLRLPEARASYRLTGQGVLVALVDTGLDWGHPDFLDPAGQTRVAWLLDQTLPAAGLHPELEALGGGAVFSAAELQAALDGQSGAALGAGRDTFGHGTHVAGVAAGDDPLYAGVAPGARLVAVKAMGAGDTGFDEARVLRALAFVAEAARLEGAPVALNLSLGSQMGAHNGSEAVELALTQLARGSAPRCGVAVAAGNEGQLWLHARAPVADELRLGLRVAEAEPPSPDRPARVVVDLWHDAALEVRVESPAGARSEPVSGRGPNLAVDQRDTYGRVQLVAAAEAAPESGLWRTTLTLSGEAGAPLELGDWALVVRGSAGRLDAWIGELDLLGTPLPRFVDHQDPGTMVGPPATAADAVAVAARHHRTDWTDAVGEVHLTGVPPGALASFSTRGPTRDGRLSPTLTAPGVAVASSLSADADPRTPASMFYAGGSLRLVLPDGRHALGSGTSMAAPFATGLMALLLEQDPERTGAELRALLELGGLADADTGRALFEPGWGLGKAEAARLLGLGAGEPGGAPAEAEGLCGASELWLPDDGSRVWAVAVPRDAAGLNAGPGLPITIEADGAAFDGPVEDRGDGLYLRALRAAVPRGRVLALRCAAGGEPFSAAPELRVARSYQEASDPDFGRDGGCASAGALGGGPALLLSALGLAGLGRRAR